MREFIKKYVPSYAVKPLLLVLIGQIVAYYGTRLLLPAEAHVLSSKLDGMIPVIPSSVIIYVAAYALWVWGYTYICGRSEYMAKRFSLADLMCKAVCIVCFVLYPCTLAQPAPEEITGPCAWMLKGLYMIDTPQNLLPSMHCYMSYLIARPMLEGYTPNIAKPVRLALYVLIVLICVSTLTTKQHVIADGVTGVLLAEVMWQISGKIVKKEK